MEFVHVDSGADLEEIRKLFLEYAQSLDFKMCFKSFEDELRRLPEGYEKLVLCKLDGSAAGCVALRELEPGICEMKRLFVRPGFRGHQLGRQLVTHLIEQARNAGYSSMRLDTVPGAMDQAITLYRSLGFTDIPAYHGKSTEGAIYLELKLRSG